MSVRDRRLVVRSWWALLALTVVWSVERCTAAADVAVSSAAVKGAFLYNFAKFADWPSDALSSDGALTICTNGGRLRFAINLDSMRRHHVHLSSRVLALAQVVTDESGDRAKPLAR